MRTPHCFLQEEGWLLLGFGSWCFLQWTWAIVTTALALKIVYDIGFNVQIDVVLNGGDELIFWQVHLVFKRQTVSVPVVSILMVIVLGCRANHLKLSTSHPGVAWPPPSQQARRYRLKTAPCAMPESCCAHVSPTTQAAASVHSALLRSSPHSCLQVLFGVGWTA